MPHPQNGICYTKKLQRIGVKRQDMALIKERMVSEGWPWDGEAFPEQHNGEYRSQAVGRHANRITQERKQGLLPEAPWDPVDAMAYEIDFDSGTTQESSIKVRKAILEVEVDVNKLPEFLTMLSGFGRAVQ